MLSNNKFWNQPQAYGKPSNGEMEQRTCIPRVGSDIHVSGAKANYDFLAAKASLEDLPGRQLASWLHGIVPVCSGLKSSEWDALVSCGIASGGREVSEGTGPDNNNARSCALD
jgi:hypothetical protein